MVDDEFLRDFCLEFRKGIIGRRKSKGMCAVVTWALQGYLSFALNLKTEVHESEVGNWNHVYLVMEDGRVLDATADQFNDGDQIFPYVYLGPPLDIHNGNVFER